MIDPLVRPAEPKDAGQLRWLESLSRGALADQRGGPRWLATHSERAAAWEVQIDAGMVFAGCIDGVVIGYLVASRRDDLLQIDEVFVHPEARELGFGDELLAAAIAAGRQMGCSLLEGESLPGDRATKNLYERAGIKARLITVSTEI